MILGNSGFPHMKEFLYKLFAIWVCTLKMLASQVPGKKKV
jgi:hypothetical protein